MKFYLELSNGMDTFRLQKDMGWRSVENRGIVNTDFLAEKPQEIVSHQKKNATLIINNKEWAVNMDWSEIGDATRLYYYAFILREDFPNIPSRIQLVEIIRNGNDKKNNSLILNAHGNFELKDMTKGNLSIEDPTIVLRYEAWIAGNGYVGDKAANHTIFIDDVYLTAIDNWLTHLKTGGTNIYSDLRSSKQLDELLKEIEGLKSNF